MRTDGTDGQTDGRTDARPFHRLRSAYSSGGVSQRMSGDLALPALGKFPPHSILVIVWPFRFQFQSAEMPPSIKLSVICSLGWLGSRVFIVLDSGLRRRRARVQIAVATLSGNSEIGSSPLKGCGGNCGSGGNNGSLPRGL